jgi:Smg protein
MARRYIEVMFEVLAFVYDNYLDRDACPELPILHRTLNTLGFAHREVEIALLWLEDLKSAARLLPVRPAAEKHVSSCTAAMRVLTNAEIAKLGVAGWGLLAFLTSTGTLPGDELELVMEQTMAAPCDLLSLDDLKLIVLMVFWGLAREPDALVLDELCEDHSHRQLH